MFRDALSYVRLNWGQLSCVWIRSDCELIVSQDCKWIHWTLSTVVCSLMNTAIDAVLPSSSLEFRSDGKEHSVTIRNIVR